MFRNDDVITHSGNFAHLSDLDKQIQELEVSLRTIDSHLENIQHRKKQIGPALVHLQNELNQLEIMERKWKVSLTEVLPLLETATAKKQEERKKKNAARQKANRQREQDARTKRLNELARRKQLREQAAAIVNSSE